jgi:hypothetical protein
MQPPEKDLQVCSALLKALKNKAYADQYLSFSSADSRRAWIGRVLINSSLPKDRFGDCLGALRAEGKEDFRRFLDWHLQLPCPNPRTTGRDLSMQKSRFDSPEYCQLILDSITDIQPQTKTQEGNTMSISIELTSQTLLNGKEITNYTNQELYRIISKEEGYIAELKAVKAKPKRLVKEIAQREDKLKELVELLDKQDGENATQ